MRRPLAAIASGVLCAVIGLAGGWFAANQMSDAQSPATAEDDPHAADPAEVGLPPQTLENLGVTIEPARLESIARTREVQAVVVDRPANRRPITAPVGGFITHVHAQTGQVVTAGAPIITMARDPIPRPKPELTADILTPVSENVHEAIAKLRTARNEVSLVERELERIRAFTSPVGNGSAPLIPKQRAIELAYDLSRAQQSLSNARHELERHGLSRKELDELESGGRGPSNQMLWKRALENNGLWTRAADAIYKSLSEEQQKMPWAVAAIGELSAAGLATMDLARVIGSDKPIRTHFVEVAPEA